MTARVTSFSVRVEEYAVVKVPSWIHLDPEEDGVTWWVRYNTLYYTLNGETHEYQLDLQYDGDYKRPEIEDIEEEVVDEDEEDIEQLIEQHIEVQSEILRGK